jgi:hypothetical protein
VFKIGQPFGIDGFAFLLAGDTPDPKAKSKAKSKATSRATAQKKAAPSAVLADSQAIFLN